VLHDGFPFLAGAASGNGTPGQPVAGPGQLLPRLLAGLGFEQPFLERGKPASLSVSDRPGAPQLLVLSAHFAPAYLTVAPEPATVFSDPWFVFTIVTADANGAAKALLHIPDDVSLAGLLLFAQGFGVGLAQPLIVGTPTGAVVR
jgi:hypothetical protein